jgi:hypothetical protein
VVFGQSKAVLDIVGKIFFTQKLNVINEVRNHRILKLPYFASTLKIYSPSFHEIYKIITIKDQRFFFGIIPHNEILHSKIYENLMLFGNLQNFWK